MPCSTRVLYRNLFLCHLQFLGRKAKALLLRATGKPKHHSYLEQVIREQSSSLDPVAKLQRAAGEWRHPKPERKSKYTESKQNILSMLNMHLSLEKILSFLCIHLQSDYLLILLTEMTLNTNHQ